MKIKKHLEELLEEKNIAILGFGVEGISTYKLLRKYFPNKIFSVLDQNIDLINNPLLKDDYLINLYLGENYLDNINDFDLIIKSPGISFKKIPIDTNKISSQTDIFLSLFKKNTIGITGTKGKSTTATLLYHILSQNNKNVFLAGNIGLAPFDIIEKINKNSIIVFELSSHQLEYSNNSPHISVLLNIFEEHLDHYKSFQDYKLAKYNIAKFQDVNDFFICNSDNKNIQEFIKTHKYQLIKYSEINIKKQNNIAILHNSEKQIEIDLSKFKLRGNHNLLNLLAILKVLNILNYNIVETIEHSYSFYGLEHRLEYVGKFNGISFYNDSIATIPEACISAINTFSKVDYLILGGYNRGINYDVFSDYLIEKNISYLFLIDEVGKILESKISLRYKGKIILSKSIEEAVKYIYKNPHKDGLCLFSPAAKTPPPLKNFKERGALFKKSVYNYNPDKPKN